MEPKIFTLDNHKKLHCRPPRDMDGLRSCVVTAYYKYGSSFNPTLWKFGDILRVDVNDPIGHMNITKEGGWTVYHPKVDFICGVEDTKKGKVIKCD